MNVSRRYAMLLVGSALAVPGCAKNAGAIRIGSKNFTESVIVAEIYAQALERAAIPVLRKFELGSTQIALAALVRGDIDLYPEYTGTGLIDVLHHAPLRDERAIYKIVQNEFEHRFDVQWLAPSPMNDSQGLATTRALAERYGLRTLSDLSAKAPQLRLATIPEFVSRADGLPGLQHFYGGFQFKDVKTYEIGLKYQALLTGAADVATAFTTDGQIAADRLVVLDDDRQMWPPYHVAPIVRRQLLTARPHVAALLDRIGSFITTEAAQTMNAAVDVDKHDPGDVASEFVKAHPE
ncbi:MAG: glycine/betaine ABC transporter substrate-binding protein [Candidatus Eremiobacteraeota bacterium]|nr:glycine/betaine ABC transporter substrate-binding protein [Candidatus Eremiobacteraeota bacterium]